MFSYKGGGGIDISKYLPLSYFAQNLAGSSSYANVFSYTGEGFISLAAVGTGGNTLQLGIKIIADGVTVFDGMTSNFQYAGAGVCQLSDLVGYGSTNFANLSIPFTQAGILFPAQTYPYTGGAANAVCILDVPIFFKSSIVIQAKTTTSSISNIVIQGGKKA